MDCCNYGQYGAGAAWEACGGGPPYPAPYQNYAPPYYAPHAHDPYARYYRYDYQPQHMHHAEYAMPMGGYHMSSPASARDCGHVVSGYNTVCLDSRMMQIHSRENIFKISKTILESDLFFRGCLQQTN